MIKGADIPLWARIIAIADTVDAMTTDRPYRSALSADVVRDELNRMAGRQFDPELAGGLVAEERWVEMANAIVLARAPAAQPVDAAEPIPRHSAAHVRLASS